MRLPQTLRDLCCPPGSSKPKEDSGCSTLDPGSLLFSDTIDRIFSRHDGPVCVPQPRRRRRHPSRVVTHQS